MNWNASAGTDVMLPAIASPAETPQVATVLSDAEGDWLCAWCLNRVADEKDRFKYDGKDAFAFSNPAGIRFEIITFAQTPGCRQAGAATLEHTWFPGHAWSFCMCGRCGCHLGWYYAGQHDFAGLMTNRIVRGQSIRN